MNSRIIGFILLALIIIGGAAYYLFGTMGYGGQIFSAPTERITLKGYIGSEKSNFLENPEIQRLLKSRYGITLDYSKAGSIEQVRMDLGTEIDFLWPSSQVALELFKLTRPGLAKKSEIVFNSPIVVYSWDIVTEALIAAGVVEQIDSAYYIIDFPALLALLEEETSWAEIGLDQLYGKLSVISTDPTKSNSGNMFSGLIANLYYGDVVSMESLDSVLPRVVDFFRRLGYMEHSTGILYEQYLRKGVGSYPLIVGYENQIVEFSLQNPELWPRVKEKMRILYPIPTVWSSHPIIALNERAEVLIEALQDPDIQQLAWEQHGFRSGLIGIENDPAVLEIAGIPAEITKVIPMPQPEVMDRIISALEGENQ